MQENNKEKILELHKQIQNKTLTPTLMDAKIEAIDDWSNDQILGIILLLNTNRKQRGRLLLDLHSVYIMGNNNCPGSFMEAFLLLLNHRKERVKAKETTVKDATEQDGDTNFAQQVETPVPGSNRIVHLSAHCCNCGLAGNCTALLH